MRYMEKVLFLIRPLFISRRIEAAELNLGDSDADDGSNHLGHGTSLWNLRHQPSLVVTVGRAGNSRNRHIRKHRPQTSHSHRN